MKMQFAQSTLAVCVLCFSALQIKQPNLNSNGRIASSDNTPTANNTSTANNIQAELNILNAETSTTNIFNDLMQYLKLVKDPQTAVFIAPKIQTVNTKIEIVIEQISTLTASERDQLAILTFDNLGLIERLIDEVIHMPGVAPILEPVVAPLMGKLSILAQIHTDANA